jgi:prefoldin subunit 5
MTAATGGTGSLAEIIAELRYIRQQVDQLSRRFEEAEKDRQARGETLAAQHAEVRETMTRHELRLSHVERLACTNEDELRALIADVNSLKTQTRANTAVLVFVGVAVVGWVIERLLAVIP